MEVDLIIGPSASSSVVALSASFCPPPNQSPSFIVIAAWTVSPPTVIDESSLRRLRICMPDFEADKGGGGWDEEDESKKPARGKAGRDSLSGMPVGTCVMENEVRKVGKGGREEGRTVKSELEGVIAPDPVSSSPSSSTPSAALRTPARPSFLASGLSKRKM